jgi:anti-sigma regulatory factor (Ser/Thr protein kinase)
MVRSHLEAWGLENDLPALELAVSELVTNAIVHGRGLIDVRIAVDEGRIRLDVGDEGSATGRPAVRHDDGVGGWGLRLVEGLSDDWGLAREGARTHVWMERRTQGWPHERYGE